MLRFIARSLGLWLLAGALVALVVDGARSIAASEIVLTPLAALWLAISPTSLDAARVSVESRLHPWLWDPLIATLLLAPASAALALVGAGFLYVGQKPSPPLPER